jgi:hypothetical protein
VLDPDPRLALEPAHQRLGAQLGVEQLERHLAPVRRDRAMHHAHPATAELLEQPVRSDAVSGW